MNIATIRAVTISIFGFLVIVATSSSFYDGNSNVICIESERQALLRFKQDLIDDSNRLSSWVEGEDCCKWVGVFCDNLSGHVKELHLGLPSKFGARPKDEYDAYFRSMLRGKISPSLLELKHLSFLDLSNNNFSGIHIPEFIGLLRSLTYLNLSTARFGGAIPQKLGNLSKLQYLELGDNYRRSLESKTFQWVSGLSSLKYLKLRAVDLITATDWLQVTSNLPSLVELHLSFCNLNTVSAPISANFTSLAVLDLSGNTLSSVPKWIYSLRSLASIDLSYNSFRGPFPEGFQNFSSLKVLDFGYNNINSLTSSSLSRLNDLQFLSLSNNYVLQGEIPRTIGNLSSIVHLDLSVNQIQGIAPAILENLCNLREMDLSYNKIDQEVSEILQGVSRCSLDKLESLNMEKNYLSGHLLDQLGQFKKLAYLLLSENFISGPIPFSIGELSSLKSLEVSNNRLNGTLPQSIGQLVSLENLFLTHNLFEGVVTEMHFSNLTKLRYLEASENMLTFKPNPNWVPPFDCATIELSYWHLGPQFPPWLQFQKNLSAIAISNAGISDVIPSWFWNLSTQYYVDLSYNQLVGEISHLFKSFVIDLSSNQFNGPLPRVFPDIKYLFLSNNSFSGSLSRLLCNLSSESLSILHIKNNLLSGEISDCWKNLPSIQVLNLGNNNLTGKIPRSLGSLNLYALNLRNNSLFGELPSTLQNCTSLSLLDLSENHLSGSIPAWIGNKLPRLVALGLRSNNFHGHIPNQICALSYLQALDLGHNNISGGVPKCFSNLSAMATKNPTSTIIIGWIFYDSSFMEGILLVRKGREDEYSTILRLVTSLDLSNNILTGEIPKELGSLKGLQSLNLSRNLLTGKIPLAIGNMGLLESLDISMNRLYGEIPPSFSNLNFLSYLNLSYNNLTGQIPSSTQLQSFDKFSYIGNHLCGPPVTRNCSTKGSTLTPNVSEERNQAKVNIGLYVSIVLGFVMGFWGVVAPLLFIKSWRFAYYKKLEHIGRKLSCM